jgi:hypothetical protein
MSARLTRRQFAATSLAAAGLTIVPAEFRAVGAANLLHPRRKIIRTVKSVRRLAQYLGIPLEDVNRVVRAKQFRKPPFPDAVRYAEIRPWTFSIFHHNTLQRRIAQIDFLYRTLAGRKPTADEAVRALYFLLDTSPAPTSRRAWLRRSTAHAQDLDTGGGSGTDADLDLGTLVNTHVITEVGNIAFNPWSEDYWGGWEPFSQLWDFAVGLFGGSHLSPGEQWRKDQLQAMYDRQLSDYLAAQEYMRTQWWVDDPASAFFTGPEAGPILGALNTAMANATGAPPPEHSGIDTTIHVLSAFKNIGVGLGLALFGASPPINQANLAVWREFSTQIRLGAIGVSIAYGFVGLNISITGPGLVLLGFGLIAFSIAYELFPLIRDALTPHSGPGADGLLESGPIEAAALPYPDPVNAGAVNLLEDVTMSKEVFDNNPHYWIEGLGPGSQIYGGYDIGEPPLNDNPTSEMNQYARDWEFTWGCICLGG